MPRKSKDKDVPLCTIKVLPEHQWVEAARVAVAENPANSPPKDLVITSLGQLMTTLAVDAEEDDDQSDVQLIKSRLAVMTGKYWGTNGVDLTVGFLEPTPQDLRERILSHMNSWSEYAKVNFRWTNTSPQVRITRNGDGYWSYLGMDVLHIPPNEPTMCLQAFTMSTPESEYKRVVRHETGHTLGFPHEHLRQQLISKLDVAKTIAWGRAALGWDEATVRSQILTPLSEASIRGTPEADQDSIMCYQLPASITKDGKVIRGGLDIDALDGQFAGKLYPKGDAPPAGKTRIILEFSADGVPTPTVSRG